LRRWAGSRRDNYEHMLCRRFRRFSVMYILHRWRKSRRLAGYRQPPGPRGTPITASSRDRRTLRQRVSAHGRGEQASGEPQGSQSTPKRDRQNRAQEAKTQQTNHTVHKSSKINENTTNGPTYCSQRVTPNKCLPVALPFKSIKVPGIVVVPHIESLRFQ